jgi:hypothetical protein
MFLIEFWRISGRWIGVLRVSMPLLNMVLQVSRLVIWGLAADVAQATESRCMTVAASQRRPGDYGEAMIKLDFTMISGSCADNAENE